jgi:alpha-tubulin suppressor-like RCC1 family protein
LEYLRSLSRPIRIALITLWATSCRDAVAPNPEFQVTRVAVTAEPSGPVFSGDSVQLRAVAHTANRTVMDTATFTWAVSDSTIASVDARGVVRIMSAGTITVSATTSGVKGSLQLSSLGTPLLSPQPVQSVIASGSENKCAISLQQDAYCWGWNGHGGITFLGSFPASILGVGDTVANVVTPLKVVGGLKFIDVAITEESSSLRCGIVTDRSVYCWGKLPWMPQGWEVPTRIPGAVQFNTLSGGGYHLCGVDVAGDVYCWGDNRYGQAASGPSSAFDTPRKVQLPEQITAVAAGGWMTCALTVTGRVYCWGNYSEAAGAELPKLISTPAVFTRIDAIGSDLCALDRAGRLYCWTTQANSAPILFSTAQRLKSITLGSSRTCGIAIDDIAYCWGDNSSGQLGDGTTVNAPASAPARVDVAQPFIELAGVGSSTCGVTTTNDLYCWGGRQYGQVGDGISNIRRTPVLVAGGPFTAISGYYRQPQCALTAAGQAFCWGGNDRAQLGDGTTTDRRVPTAVATTARFQSIETNVLQTCALSVDSIAYCWGPSNPNQQIVSLTAPAVVATDIKFTAVTPGWQHGCGLTSSRAAYCWGQGNMGALGTGTFSNALTPQPVTGGHQFTQLRATNDVTCGLTTNGAVYCWGASQFFATVSNSECTRFSTRIPCTNMPQHITGLPPIREISTEFCAIGFNDDLYCWDASGVLPLAGIRAAGFAGMGTLPLDQVSTLRVFDVNGDVYRIQNVNGSLTLVKGDLPMKFTALSGQCGISNATTYCWGSSIGAGDGVPDYVAVPQRVGFP